MLKLCFQTFGPQLSVTSLASILPNIPLAITNTSLTITNTGNNKFVIGDRLATIVLKIVNNTVHLVGEPPLIPTVEFAKFREDPTYVKVR